MLNLIPIDVALFINMWTLPIIFGFSAGIISALLWKKHYENAVTFAISLLMTTIIVWTLKHILAIPRPPGGLIQLTDYAFPSGHAAFSMYLATMLSFLIARTCSLNKFHLFTLRVLFFSTALYICFSRLTLGVHTPLQIIAGALIGTVISVCVVRFDRYVFKYLRVRK